MSQMRGNKMVETQLAKIRDVLGQKTTLCAKPWMLFPDPSIILITHTASLHTAEHWRWGLGFLSIYTTHAYTVFSTLQEDIEKCCIVVVRDQVGFKIGPSLKRTTLGHLHATQEDYIGPSTRHSRGLHWAIYTPLKRTTLESGENMVVPQTVLFPVEKEI
jgi:hypothetical protein